MIDNHLGGDSWGGVVGKECFIEICGNDPGSVLLVSVVVKCGVSREVGSSDPWSKKPRDDLHVILAILVPWFWLVCLSGFNFDWMVLGHVCSSWGVACLSKVAAALCQPAVVQAHWGNGLVCLSVEFYVHTSQWDQK